MKNPDTTTIATTTQNEARSMTVFCRAHPLEALRPRLAAEGIVTAKELRRLPSGKRVRITGVLVIIHMPPTKSGKRVIFITLEDETGLIDLVVFPKAQVKYAKVLLTSEIQTVEGKLYRAGKDGRAISIVVESVIPHLTGSLEKALQLGHPENTSPDSRAEVTKSYRQ